MNRSSKAEDLYILIRDQILSGRWKPGDRLNDAALADEFQVSRTSVREALFRLIETGIIVKEHWKGYFIKEITEKIVSNIIELRIALESCAIKNFVHESTEEDLKQLDNILTDCKACLAEGDLLKYLTTDFSFHEMIYTNQHNQYITATLNNYMLTIHFIRYQSMGKDDDFMATAQNSLYWHGYILDAIKERNAVEAEKRLVAHLNEHEQEAKRNLTSAQ